MKKITRRDALRNGTAGLFAVGVAGLAGCTASIPGMGDDGATVTNWLANPSFDDVFVGEEYEEQLDEFEVEDSEVTDLNFDYLVPEAVFDNEQELNGLDLVERYGSSLRTTIGVPAMETDWALEQQTSWSFDYSYEQEFGGGETSQSDDQISIETTIIGGSFEPDDVVYELEEWVEDQYPDGVADERELSSEGEYEGYELYYLEVQHQAFAINSSHIIEVSGDGNTDSIAAIESVLDTRWDSGADSRWAEGTDFEDVFAQYDPGHRSRGQLTLEPFSVDDFEGIEEWLDGFIGSITSYEIDGATSDVTQLYAYENERDASVDDLREFVENNRDIGEEFETLEDFSVADEGSILVVTGTVRTSTID